MSERKKEGSSQRSRLAKVFLRMGKFQEDASRLTPSHIAVGVGLSLLFGLLLTGYDVGGLPQYQVGDVVDRTIEASRSFTVLDEAATEERIQEVLKTVPAVFDLDFRVNNQIEQALRRAFGSARDLIVREREWLELDEGEPLNREGKDYIYPQLRELIPRFDQGGILDICFDQGFSVELEDQMARLLMESMKSPGVVLSREELRVRDSDSIVLRNTISGQEAHVSDWAAIKNVPEARNVLRQNEFELTAVTGEAKRRVVQFLEDWVAPNVRFNLAATVEREKIAAETVPPVLIQIKEGRAIVRAGDEITENNLAVLEALQAQTNSKPFLGRYLGTVLLVILFFSGLWIYFSMYQKRVQGRPMDFILLFTILSIGLVVTQLTLGFSELLADGVTFEGFHDPVHLNLMAPLALVAILTVLLLGIDLAVAQSFVFSLLVVLLTQDSLMTVLALTQSLAAVYLLRQYRERTALIQAGLIIGLMNTVVLVAYQFAVSELSFSWQVWLIRTGAVFAGSIFSAMFASLLLPPLEWLFQVTTDIRLLELSNLNTPILRRMALEAPGTYHHSLTVGTLAEAGAESIGANSLLVRVGAYYHDIGKLKNPEYFVENQIYSANKHERLSPHMSSLILASHVKDGLALAREISLTPKVKDLIPQHHGTKLMTYFYRKACDSMDEKSQAINESDFRYPGPKPQTKEAAILMLADQVEAASRTLEDPNRSQIRGLIKQLVQSTIQDGQFNECDVSLRELDLITEAFERVLEGMHHQRVEYPGFNFNEKIEKSEPEFQRIQ